MTRQTIPLGRIFGIPIGLDYSWFLIFALLSWSLATSYFPQNYPPQNYPRLPVGWYWLAGAAAAVMLFVCVLLHELGHSVVAIQYGVPVRSITMFIFGGVAEIGAEPPGALAEFFIAIAGPIVSLLLAVLFYLLGMPLPRASLLAGLVGYLALLNFSLVLFNLIPGFPLDGGRVLRAIIWGITHNMARATLFAANVGRFFGFCFIFLGVWQVFSQHFVNGLWIAFIGWFLESAASAQARQAMLQRFVSGHTVAEAMNHQPSAVDEGVTLQQLLDEHILGNGRRALMVTHGPEVAGMMTLHQLRETPREQWTTTTAGQIMIPAAKLKATTVKADLWSALEEMDRDGFNQLPVLNDGKVVGILSREDLITFLRSLQDLRI